MTIQAIETKYNGYRFRSRLEARWAVFFDTMGTEYAYENEGFRSKPPDEDREYFYLPDFWIPKFSSFLEIKGEFDYESAKRTSVFVNALMEARRQSFKYAAVSIVMDINHKPFETFDNPHVHYWKVSEDKKTLDGVSRPELWAECPICNKLAKTCACSHCVECEHWFIDCPDCLRSLGKIKVKRAKANPTTTPKILAAYEAARSARFEHGETPKVPRGKPR